MPKLEWILDGEIEVRKWLSPPSAATAEAIFELIEKPRPGLPRFIIDHDRGMRSVIMVPADGVHYFVALIKDD